MRKTFSFILNFPYTFIGLLVSIISLPRLKIDFNARHLAIIIYARSFWWAFGYMNGARAMAIGHVVILGPNLEKYDLEHELVHVEQHMRFPIIFPILNLIELFRVGYKNNKYEVEAYSRAGNLYKER